MRVVVAGNYRLAPALVAMHLLRELASLPIDSRVSLRAPLRGQPGPIETLAESLCRELKIPVDWYVPTPGSGSVGTIERDQRMVDGAGMVIAYFHPDLVMDPDTGTGRVVKMAINTDTPVEAYRPTDDAVESVGSAP